MPVQIRMNGFYAIRGISRKDHLINDVNFWF